MAAPLPARTNTQSPGPSAGWQPAPGGPAKVVKRLRTPRFKVAKVTPGGNAGHIQHLADDFPQTPGYAIT